MDIVLIAIMVLVLYLLIFPEREEVKHVTLNNYTTDTIHNHYHYKINPIDTNGIVVKPRIVVNFPKNDLQGIQIQLQDSLLKVIDSLTKTIVMINQDYLKQYPTSSKLIFGKFTQDSLQLDLLGISGDISSLHYPVNYSEFTYTYVDGKLKAQTRAKDINGKPPKLTQGLVAYAGYDIISKTPFNSIYYNLEFKKFNLGIEPKIYLRSQPQFFVEGKLGYRIK